MDITEQKRRKKQLQRTEKRYRAVFENTGTAMMIIEEDTTISLANSHIVDLTGYSRDEVEGKKSWTEFVAEDGDLERMKEYHKARRKDPSTAPNQYEFKLADRAGNIRNILMTIDMIPGTNKSVASLNDITKQKKREKELEETTIGTLRALSRTVEAKDEYTGEHLNRVQGYALEVGEKLGLTEGRLEQLKYASELHDIGKVRVSESILGKPADLTNEEWSEMEKHPEIGERIVRQVDRLERAAKIIGQHQEKYDGTGYPKGLEGEDITLEARILAVADAWDAMRSNRPYRDALPKKEAIKELKENAGTQFDPEIVELVLEMIENDEGEVEFGD